MPEIKPIKINAGLFLAKIRVSFWKSAVISSLIIATIMTVGLFILFQPRESQPLVYPVQKSLQPETFPKSVSASPSAKIATSSADKIPLMTNNLNGPGIPILLYHYIGNNPNPADLQRNALDTSPDNFDAQLGYLSQHGFTPITLDTLWAIFGHQATAPPKPIIITIDDGYIDFSLNAFPILQKYGFHAVSFIITGLVGKPAYMSWDQIQAIQRSGLVSFEDHTISHPTLPSLSYNQMLIELTESKKILEAETGTPVNFVAYPYGSVNDLVIRAARSSGYVGGVGTWLGKATVTGMDLPRIRVGNISLADFAARVGN